MAYFVGCDGFFFQRSCKVPQTFVQILDHAGVDYALLGGTEWCCGCPIFINIDDPNLAGTFKRSVYSLEMGRGPRKGGAMKKLINKTADFVRESLEGMAAAHSDQIKVNLDPIFVYRADAPVKGKVAVISGGGSGHEPTHVGFVGQGMLDAACPGDVFVSPTTEQITEAIRTVQGGAGVLNVVKCYWDDMDVFAEAAELAHAEGIPAANILIDDDVAVSESVYSHGRRGTGTTVLAEKICGAAAEQGYHLPGLADLCRRVNLNGRSMGMAFTACTVPAKGVPSFEIGENEMEVGIGIHGEPGRERMSLKTGDQKYMINLPY